MTVIGENGRPMLHIRSLHKVAGRTVRESAKQPILEAKYESREDGITEHAGKAEDEVISAEGYISLSGDKSGSTATITNEAI